MPNILPRQFLPYTRGAIEAGLEIFEQIKKDPRHEHVEVMNKGPRSRRVFTENGMILLSDRDIPLKYSTGRSLSADMNTLLNAEDKGKSLSSKLFWERIRNRILTYDVA